jgi:hypothetical protein
MQKTLIALGLLSLGGCATSTLNDGLAALVGQPIESAIGRLGYPDGQMMLGEDTVYAWGRNFSMNMPQYRTATTTGYVGSTPVSGTTGYMSSVPIQYQCDVKIIVGSDKLIKDYDYSGDVGGCHAYSKAVKIRK